MILNFDSSRMMCRDLWAQVVVVGELDSRSSKYFEGHVSDDVVGRVV